MYSAIVFDLFGTLVPAYAHENVLSQMAVALGIDATRFNSAFAEETRADRETGQYGSLYHNIRDLCDQYGRPASDAQIGAAVRIHREFTRAALVPRNDALSVLSSLKARRLAIGLISDTCEVGVQLWSETPLAALVDSAVFSYTAGVKKPDPRIYHLVCEALAV